MYILQEIQTTKESTALVPARTFTNKNDAESAFHLALSYAAVSEVEIHTVILYNEHGSIIRSECYEHVA